MAQVLCQSPGAQAVRPIGPFVLPREAVWQVTAPWAIASVEDEAHREEISVSKATITRVFLGSVIAVVAGVILAIAAVAIAFANGVFIMDGPDVIGVRGTGLAWTMVGLAIVASLVVMGGFVGGLVAWIGALLNTAQLDDKVWFLVLLLLGIWNLGVFAMVAYVIAGPDGKPANVPRDTYVTA